MTSTDGLIAQVALEHYEAFNTGSSHNKDKKRTEQGRAASASCRGKPNPESEWTVYSALVALRRRRRFPEGRSDPSGTDGDGTTEETMEDDAWVVSCATGTKCTTERRNGWILHDCHGEVLVRRGLVCALLDEVARRHRGPRRHQSTQDFDAEPMHERNRCLLEPIQRAEGVGASTHWQFQLRPDTTLHLYISDSPCGDASIYELVPSAIQPSSSIRRVGAAAEEEGEKKSDRDANNSPAQTGGNVQFTGSKLVVPSRGDEMTRCCTDDDRYRPELHVLSRTATGGSLLVREVGSNQLLGRLRSKSSRSNVARRSCSLSCSDKICRWQVLGWQGCGLLPILPDPIRVTSVVVSRDPRSAPPPSVAAAHARCCDQEGALQRALVDRVTRSLTGLRSAAADGEASSTDTEESRRRVCREFHFRASVTDAAFANGKSHMLLKQMNQLSTTVAGVDAKGLATDAKDPAASNRKRKRAGEAFTKKISPCGFALNWNASMGHDALPEVLVGARGVRQGKVPRSDAEHRALSSQLCRANLAALTRRALAESRSITPVRVKDDEEAESASPMRYQAFKRALAPPGYARLRNQLFHAEASPLAGWLVDEHEGDFELARHEDKASA
jgi:Adenosine-deaminase (editase) domain